MTTKVPVELSSTPGIVDGSNATAITIDSSGDIKNTGGTTTTHTIFADSGSSEGSANITFNTDGASADQSVANIKMQQGSGDGGSRKGEIHFQVSDNGAPGTAMSISNNKAVTFASTIAAADGSVTAPSVRGTDTNTGIFFPSGGVTAISRNGVEGCRMTAGGDFGIGTSSPQEKLHVYDASGSAAIRVSGEGNNNRKIEIGYDTSDGPVIRAGSSGQTGIKLYYDNTSLGALLHTNGDWYTNDGTVHSLSDARVKEDVTDLNDGLDIVKQLKPKTFKYNSKAEFYNEIRKDEIKYGFIADEVKEVAPQYTNTQTGKIDGKEVDDLKTLSTTKMIPMLVKAIQEQQTIIDDLKTRIKTLEDA